MVFIYVFIYCFTAQVLKVCRTPGPTAYSKTKMVHLDKVCLNRLHIYLVLHLEVLLVSYQYTVVWWMNNHVAWMIYLKLVSISNIQSFHLHVI